jgi:beta-phosphoglucomutase-like phosphatase (HAD superfamily)
VTPPAPVVFLLDVDNTLLDNDRIIADLKRHLAQAFRADTPADVTIECLGDLLRYDLPALCRARGATARRWKWWAATRGARTRSTAW